MVNLAKKWLLEYLSDGEVKQPTDFDKDFLGKSVDPMLLVTGRPMWNDTPFFPALAQLIKEGKVIHWRDGEGNCYYQIDGSLSVELEQILRTPVGERVMLPDLGSQLGDFMKE